MDWEFLEKVIDKVSQTKPLIIFGVITIVAVLLEAGRIVPYLIEITSFIFGCWVYRKVKDKNGKVTIVKVEKPRLAIWEDLDFEDIVFVFFMLFVMSVLAALIYWIAK